MVYSDRMGLKIRFETGERAGIEVTFDDTVTQIVIGRDPNSCQVVFASHETQVGRRHCALKPVLGGYRLALRVGYAVLVDSRPARDGQHVPGGSKLQIGPSGPTLAVESWDPDGLPATDLQTPLPKAGLRDRLRKLYSRRRRDE